MLVRYQFELDAERERHLVKLAQLGKPNRGPFIRLVACQLLS